MTKAAIELHNAELKFGQRTLWHRLNLEIKPGEFFAVLGPNGSGKTSLLKVLLGLQPLSGGTLLMDGAPVTRGSRSVGYIPQQKSLGMDTPLRARDLVALGVDGHRWGVRWRSAEVNKKVDQLLEVVGASAYAKVPVGQLSGGEQQRLRVAQALASDPKILLCDEPLLSLDLRHQQEVSALVNERCRKDNAAVVFVTHEINPIIDYVDRVLYLAGGDFRIGPPEEVMTTSVLSELYGSHVEAIHSNGRIVVVGIPDGPHHEEEETE
ncbi:metal ABC transporter ATP-binding protein [Pseudarthrobacter sp. J1738]|uniref:metal ABC transporter ATP-binding protein n=1 Tax=unclassified Pseudarthrobacter TaxID=2647000 RepID=UPI003D2DF99F